MKPLISNHKVDFNEIRRLALICHGLDLTTSSFSKGESKIVLSESLENSLQLLLSSNLLNLAIAIRVNIYQSNISSTHFKLKEGATIYYDDASPLVEFPATLKQVCDKIIHADSVEKLFYPKNFVPADCKIALQFKGKEHNKTWTLNLALEVFAEQIFKILDDLETEKAL